MRLFAWLHKPHPRVREAAGVVALSALWTGCGAPSVSPEELSIESLLANTQRYDGREIAVEALVLGDAEKNEFWLAVDGPSGRRVELGLALGMHGTPARCLGQLSEATGEFQQHPEPRIVVDSLRIMDGAMTEEVCVWVIE